VNIATVRGFRRGTIPIQLSLAPAGLVCQQRGLRELPEPLTGAPARLPAAGGLARQCSAGRSLPLRDPGSRNATKIDE